MAKAIDLTGQVFGPLTVLERDFEIQKKYGERQAWWVCQCSLCGHTKSLRANVLKKAKSCGCVKGQGNKGKTMSLEMKTKIGEGVKNSEKHKAAMKTVGEQARENLIGNRYNRLVVLEYADEQHQKYYNGVHRTTWKCQCDCGNICYVTGDCLKKGDSPSCGCITKENRKAAVKNLSGQRFGHLLVLEWRGTINRNSRYLVRCDCGKEYEVYASNLTSGATQSCGCIKESHGETKIKKLLTENNIKFETQKIFSNFRYQDTQQFPRYDFYLPDYNILIEYDGEQHYRQVMTWDTEERFQQRQKRDSIKTDYALQNNIILIRIPYYHYDHLSIEDLLEKSNFRIQKE